MKITAELFLLRDISTPELQGLSKVFPFTNLHRDEMNWIFLKFFMLVMIPGLKLATDIKISFEHLTEWQFFKLVKLVFSIQLSRGKFFGYALHIDLSIWSMTWISRKCHASKSSSSLSVNYPVYSNHCLLVNLPVSPSQTKLYRLTSCSM